MGFDVQDLALECIRLLRVPLERIRLHDPALADQLRRAASSVALNIAEGRWRTGKDKTNRFRIAAGSASEARACLQICEAWGLVSAELVSKPLEVIDRLLA
jgi:four helix bundle protein